MVQCFTKSIVDDYQVTDEYHPYDLQQDFVLSLLILNEAIILRLTGPVSSMAGGKRIHCDASCRGFLESRFGATFDELVAIGR